MRCTIACRSPRAEITRLPRSSPLRLATWSSFEPKNLVLTGTISLPIRARRGQTDVTNISDSMSMEGVNLGEPPSGSFVDSYPAESKPTYKSWKYVPEPVPSLKCRELTTSRKKFRKMKYKFEQKMRESDQLFREEQRAHDTSRRLAEENEYVPERVGLRDNC